MTIRGKMQELRSLAVTFCLVLSTTVAVVGQDQPLGKEEAAATATVPPGFQVSLFSGEPEVTQPIAMTTDDRARLWVVECHSYPQLTAEEKGPDRVSILEDSDGDGRADKRITFLEGGRNLTGIAYGFGGIYLCSTPQLIFVPDRDADDVPDGPAEVLLDGWDLTARHNVFNGLQWGPDGWLYGCNGILSNSAVGPPGASENERVKLNCGVWRFHPLRKQFEAIAHGTTNPWGVDFDAYGEAFITNCVIKHLFHVLPGGHYERMFGQDINPYSFGLLESCANHIHWAGGFWDTEGVDKPINDQFGGGHAHCGTAIYLGSSWPKEYLNSLFTVNIHGRRVNNDWLRKIMPGYSGEHRADFFKSKDPWFRGVALHFGPDESLYIADWHDTGECHDYEEVERGTGRIFKVTFGPPGKVDVNLASLETEELLRLQDSENEWFVRHSRRILQERIPQGKLLSKTQVDSLRKKFLNSSKDDLPRRLRAAWVLHAFDIAHDPEFVSTDPDLACWSIRLAADGELSARKGILNQFADKFAHESPRVRLALASALQKLPLEDRLDIAAVLVSQPEDKSDPQIPLMIWYGIEPLIVADDAAAAKLINAAKIPLIRTFIARRLVIAGRLDQVVSLASTSNLAAREDILNGIHEVLRGRRNVPKPVGWDMLAASVHNEGQPSLRQVGLFLSVIFGDNSAMVSLRKLAQDSSKTAAVRQSALDALTQQKDVELLPILLNLLANDSLRGSSIRAMAAYDDPRIPAELLGRYDKFSEGDRGDVVNTLASRPAYALQLLDAIEKRVVPRGDLSPLVARQLASLNNAAVTERLEKVWGALRPAAEGKAERIAMLKSQLAASDLRAADLTKGQSLFTKRCGACHRLFDSGGRIGPELTGAQRTNLDYLLENVLDPSALVPRDFQVTTLEMNDGRVLNGIVKSEDEVTLSLQTSTESLVVLKAEVEERTPSKLSIMPENLLQGLSDAEIRDLVGYLVSPSPVANSGGKTGN